MENTFNSTEIAIGLTTYYPKWYRGKVASIKHTDKIRGDLALEFVEKAKIKGYSVVVADGKSSKSFLHELLKISGIRIIRRRSAKRSSARRQVLTECVKKEGIKIIVLTEPEKVSIIDSINNLAESILKNQADIVIPKRKENLFKESYPLYQYESETEANELYNEAFQSFGLRPHSKDNLDMFFAPRVFRNDNKIVKLFMRRYTFNVGNFSLDSEFFDPDEYSNTLFFPVIEALRKGFRVVSVEIPFSYPTLQKKNEEQGQKELFIEKRKAQRMGLLIELLHFVSYLNKNPASRLKLAKK